MYILNDYFDYEKDLLNNSKRKDLLHQVKFQKNALVLFSFLQLLLIITLILVDNFKLLLFITFYNFVVLIYTLKIKNFKFFDVSTLAVLFFIEYLLVLNLMILSFQFG